MLTQHLRHLGFFYRIGYGAALLLVSACAPESDSTARIHFDKQFSTSNQSSSLPETVAALGLPTQDALGWVPHQKLAADDGTAGDAWFGGAVAASGDTIMVGACGDDIGTNTGQGSVYVYVRNETTWIKQAKLVADDGVKGDCFGSAVSLVGNRALVGAEGTNGGRGSVYVFERNGTTWTQQSKIVASTGGIQKYFGDEIVQSGDTALIGATGSQFGPPSVYVFVRNGTTWIQEAELVADPGSWSDAFGRSLSISGDTALIGAFATDVGTTYEQGAAYVFVRNGTTWTKQAFLVADDGAALDNLGYSVALDGDTALIGAYADDFGVDYDRGSVYIFARNGTTWTQQTKLLASDASPFDGFGSALSLSGNTLLVGAWRDRIGAFVGHGSAYVFTFDGTTWTEQAKLVTNDGQPYMWFGYDVALSGDTALVGAVKDETNANMSEGSAYVFSLRKTNGDPCTMDVDCASGACLNGTCTGKTNGGACFASPECASGFCVENVCCDSACGNGDPSDCLACSVSRGATANGTCTVLGLTTVCRSAAYDCDAIEVCNGVDPTCPVDDQVANGTTCPGGTCTGGLCIAGGVSSGAGGGSGEDVCCNVCQVDSNGKNASFVIVGLWMALGAFARRCLRNRRECAIN